MVEFADLQGRYRFAPNSLVRNSEEDYQACIDRLEVHTEQIQVPQISPHDLERFLAALSQERHRLFNRPHGNQITIRKGWLFGGKMMFRRAVGTTGVQCKLELYLNPTRFVQAHRAAIDARSVSRQTANPIDALRAKERISRNDLDALAEAKRLTLDGNDNFLTHRPDSYGLILDWDARLHHYWALVVRVLDDCLASAAINLSSFRTTPPNRPISRANWRVHQVEHYWEFAVSNAIEKIAAVSPSFRSVLTNSVERHLIRRNSRLACEFGQNGQAMYVFGNYRRQEVVAKLYAKASGVVRFEFQYKTQPMRVANDANCLSSEEVSSSGDMEHTIEALRQLGDFSWSRASELWSSFWGMHRPTGTIQAQDLIDIVKCIEDMARNGHMSSAELLSLLVSNHGGVNTVSLNEGGDVFHARSPTGRRGLSAVRAQIFGTTGGNSLYLARQRFRPLLTALRDAMDVPVEDRGRDIEPSRGRRRIGRRVQHNRMVRVRHRTRPRQ